MRKALSCLLSALLLLAAVPFTCAFPTSQAETVPESLKILCIGNSFSCDTIEHVADIALDLGVQNIKLGNLYVGGCSITKHYDHATNNSAVYQYFVNTGSGWSSTYNNTMLSAIESEDWDWISIQHGSADGSRYAEEASYADLPALIAYIKEHAGENTKIAFNMTWVGEPGSHEELINCYNNDPLSYYNAIAALTRDLVASTQGIDRVSPTGTAIQNARTSQVGILTRDNYHLSYSTGRYIAGLTFFKALTGVDISGITWAPSNMTQYTKEVAVEAANNAIATPFAVTESVLTPPAFSWPENIPYGVAATPANPYYAHAAKVAPTADTTVDLLSYFEYNTQHPSVSATVSTANSLSLTIDLNETPYLYYSFVVPEGSDFTFSIYSNATYSPWLMFLDAGMGDAMLNESAENWNDALADNRSQYATVSQTGCIDMRRYLLTDELTWIISQMKLYAPKGDSVVVSYLFFGSEAADQALYHDGDSLLPTEESVLSQVNGVVDYTLNDDGSLQLVRSAQSTIAWPSVRVTTETMIDLSETPYLHLQMTTDGGYGNGYLHYTASDGTTGTLQLSMLVKGTNIDFTSDVDEYVNLAEALDSDDVITLTYYTLSVYGVADTALTWTALDVCNRKPDADILVGDFNGDATIDTADARAILSTISKTADITAQQLAVGDINNDGALNTSDVRCILRMIVS